MQPLGGTGALEALATQRLVVRFALPTATELQVRVPKVNGPPRPEAALFLGARYTRGLRTATGVLRTGEKRKMFHHMYKQAKLASTIIASAISTVGGN